MKIYNAHCDTGEFIGESIADESPLDPGVFLIPANATVNQPPICPPNKIGVLVGDEWEVRDDWRRTDLFSTVDGAPVRVVEIGPRPENTTVTPRPDASHSWIEGAWVFDPGANLAFVAHERARAIVEVRTQRSPILDALAGIGFDALAAGDTDTVQAVAEMRAALLDITKLPALLTATTYDEMKAAVMGRYKQLAGAASAIIRGAFVEALAP